MKIICDTCGAKYSIADEKVRGKVFKIRCKKCREIIVVRGTVGAEESVQSQDMAAQASEDMGAGADYGGYDPATAAVWHVVLDGEQQGPYTAEQVAQFIAAGQLDYEAYCWRDGFTDWIHLQDIEELYSTVASMAQPQAQTGYDDNLATSVASGASPGVGADPFGGGSEHPSHHPSQHPSQPADVQAQAYGMGAATADAGYGDQGEAYAGFTAPASAGAAPASAQEAVSDLFGGGGGFGAEGAAVAPQADPTAAQGAAFVAPAASDEAARGAAHDAGADLFAPTSEDGGGMFPAAEGEDVMTSTPRIEAQRMTGTRNENSVLFSLANLQALASGSQPAPAPSAPMAAAPMAGAAPGAPPMGAPPMAAAGPSPGHATGEGSGLIDIRKMAAAAGQEEYGPAGAADDLLAIGGGGGFAPTLGAPVLLAQAPESSNKLVYALVGVGAAVVIGIVILVVVLFSGNGDDDAAVAAAQQPSVLAPQGGSPTGGIGGATQPSAAGIQPTGGPTPTPVESAAGGEGDEEEGSGGSGRGGRGRGGRRTGGGGGSESQAEAPAGSPPPSGSSAPAAATKSGRGSSDLDRLLDGALGGGGGGGAGGGSRPAKASGGGGGGGGGGNLPERLNRSQVQSGMNSVAGRVRRCGNGQRGTVMINIVISGSSGRVQSARVAGSFAGTPVGSCAARAVRSARFPRFRQSSLTVRYPFQVQ